MPQILRHPLFWLGCFLLWFGALWLLSASSLHGVYQPPVSNFDKVEHFGFFFGGTGLLCAWLFRLNPEKPNWKVITCIAVVIIGLVGWLDEYHQTFTPGRSGNDPSDWIADFSGAIAGALVFKKFHHRLK
jgi:VanZ family protein